VPKDGVPALLRYATPLHESVKVDLHVPGCPPKPQAIAHVLTELLAGRKPELAGQVKFG
jgi:coenzyme F420-reducing hydrogenase gamma subunit